MNKDIEIFKELYIDDEVTFTIGERDFSEFIKRVNKYMTSKERYKILELIINRRNNNEIYL